ncbi:MAG: hypothetical protein IPI98_14730 [Chitinophagaceae bacterium]|nr:hypothetical protein [Chitinophagaceae bacterium]
MRGSTATESNIYMDGALVNNFFTAVRLELHRGEGLIPFYLKELFLVRVATRHCTGRRFHLH